MNPVWWVVFVVLFWAIAFIFAFRISVHFLNIPTEAELELAAEEQEKAHVAHK